MPKGFAFVLVTVVMVAMLAFGLLSLSGASADLRLARKAAQSQQKFYALDGDGERLAAACGDAAARAEQAAEAFVAGGNAGGPLPTDLPAPARELAQAFAAGRESDPASLRRAMFFYYLDRNLKAMPGAGSCGWTIDQEAIRQVAAGKIPRNTPIVRLTAQVSDSSVPGRTLAVGLMWPFGSAEGYPAFQRTQWSLRVAAETIDPDPVLPVWSGKD